MTSIQSAETNHNEAVVTSIVENDGRTPREADENLNFTGRHLARTFLMAHPNAHGAKLNDGPSLHQVNSEPVLNFSLDFLVPEYDDILAKLVDTWTTRAALATYEAIQRRIKELDGVLLYWS